MKLSSLFFVMLLSLVATLIISGCAPAIVAGAAGGAAAAHDQRTAQAIVDDQFIEAKAKDAVYQDPDMAKHIHINVTSYNRVVLLTGEALSKGERARVIDIVRHIDTVRRVHNEIRIADLSSFGARSKDSWITSKVKTQMIATKGFDSTRVKVVTEAGSVYLMGLVTREQGKQAANIARQVSDVKRVVKLFEYI